MVEHKVQLKLTCYRSIGAGLLFSPRWYKHCDVFVSSLEKPVDCQLDAQA